MSRFECIPPQNLTYTVGRIVVNFQVINNYNTDKVTVCKIYYCTDSECTKAQLISVSNEVTLKPDVNSLQLELDIQQPGYYGILVHNKTDNKDECGFIIRVTTQMEQIMENMMSFIPTMIGMVVVISIAKEIGEAIGGG